METLESVAMNEGFCRKLVGPSIQVLELYRVIKNVSQHNYPLLILVESGTGIGKTTLYRKLTGYTRDYATPIDVRT